jgi:hypothetical protein
MIERGKRGDTIYRLAYELGRSSESVGPRCQEIAIEGLRSGLTTNEVYRHIGRGIQRARLQNVKHRVRNTR